MKFGLMLPNKGRPYGDANLLIELASLAEESGWEGFFLWDHIGGGGSSPCIDPWICLAAVASQTKTMRLGTMITPLARRRPQKVAREIVTLDHLLHGRAILGVGLGDMVNKDFKAFGDETGPRTRAEMLDESLDIISGLQSGKPFQYTGKHYQVSDAMFEPFPIQQPRVPVWVSAHWPFKRPLKRAARWDGVLPRQWSEGPITPDVIREKEKEMAITFRNYNHSEDYQRVSDFLIRHHQTGNLDGNWIEPAWEYMHFHPALDGSSLGRIGIWEDGGQIVSVANYESCLGEAFFQFHPAYRHLRKAMLEYAEANLTGISKKNGRKYLCAYVNDNDMEFISLMKERGYERDAEGDRQMMKFAIPNPFPPITLPEGFRLTSLAEDCDWAKVHRVLWRGFDHEGEPPAGEDELESRQRMFDTPKARRDLKVAVEAPNGNFVAFSGTFHKPTGRFAYVEPVATDPDYRRMGLGKAAVLEGIRRCGELGADTAYVGNELPIYTAIGFKKIHTSECWLKYF